MVLILSKILENWQRWRLRRGKGPPEAGKGLRGKGILRLGSGQVAAVAFAEVYFD